METTELIIKVVSSPLDDTSSGRSKKDAMDAAELFVRQKLAKHLELVGYRHSLVCASKKMEGNASGSEQSDQLTWSDAGLDPLL